MTETNKEILLRITTSDGVTIQIPVDVEDASLMNDALDFAIKHLQIWADGKKRRMVEKSSETIPGKEATQ